MPEENDLDFRARASANLQRFATQLGAYVPDPTNKRLMDPEAEYTPQQLQWMLQEYGSYISNLSAVKGKMEAEGLTLRRSSKLTRQIVMGRYCSGQGTRAAQEAQVMASEWGTVLIKNEEDMIMTDSCLIFIKGWLEAYKQAYTSASRVVEIMKAEANATGGNNRFQ
jgi:hypothetical protein